MESLGLGIMNVLMDQSPVTAPPPRKKVVAPEPRFTMRERNSSTA